MISILSLNVQFRILVLQMDETLEKLCVNSVLKLEHQHLEVKILTHIPHMP